MGRITLGVFIGVFGLIGVDFSVASGGLNHNPPIPAAPIVVAGGPSKHIPAVPPSGAAGPKRDPASDQPTAHPKEAERTPTGVKEPENKPEKAPPVRKPLLEDDDESYVVLNRLP